MKSLLQPIAFAIFSLLTPTAIGQYSDDTTFIGFWELTELQETGTQFLRRCNHLQEGHQGFQIRLDETVQVYKKHNDNQIHSYPGTWWSLQQGRMDIQYYDSTLHQMVIEGFSYSEPDDRNAIQLDRYEEFQATSDSGFSGYWKQVSTPTSNEVMYERDENQDENTASFYLELSGDATIRFQEDTKRNKICEVNGTWWSDSENYFDIQYYHKKKKRIIIEGYQIVEDGEQLRIIRTRYEELDPY